MDVPEWEHADKYLFPHFVGEPVDQYYRQELGEAVEGFFLGNYFRKKNRFFKGNGAEKKFRKKVMVQVA